MAVAALQAEYTAALFKLESGRQSMADLDRYIAEAEAEIASKPDIREVEAEGAERRLVPPSLPSHLHCLGFGVLSLRVEDRTPTNTFEL